MARITTPGSLAKMSSKYPEIDPTARKVMLDIINDKLVMEEQAVYDDGVDEIHEYTGAIDGMFVTARSARHLNGIHPRKFFILESDDGCWTLPGAFGAKAWVQCELQQKRLDRKMDEDDAEYIASLVQFDGNLS